MIKCKCGTWTDFGLTCIRCRMSHSIADTDEDYVADVENEEEEGDKDPDPDASAQEAE